MKYIIIGGVAGGATAAARIRRIDEKSDIILIEKRHHISYANCGLPYYLGNVITERKDLFVKTADDFQKRFNVQVMTETEALSIDSEKKSVKIRTPKGVEKDLTFDKLLLSPGAKPVKPKLKGIEMPGIFTLRNVGDTDQIKAYIGKCICKKECSNKKVVIVGAGFIGLEMAENLKNQGMDVSIVEMGSQIMNPVDFCMASFIQNHLIEKEVNLKLNEQVESFEYTSIDDCFPINVKLKSGNNLKADMVIFSIGVRPEISLIKNTDIKLGETGGIWVDQYLRTSVKDIFAVGDAVEFPHPITGRPWLNYLAGPANRQARIAATNMVRGCIDKYEGSIGTSIAKVFDLTVAVTGLIGRRLRELNIKYMATHTVSCSSASYYPDSNPMIIKLTYSPANGQLFGAQIVGRTGVDKRIDMFSMIIKKKGTVMDLMEIEQAYAPPYSSAKDPAAIAGYVATNAFTKEMPVLTWKKMFRELHGMGTIKNLRILDVRTPEEYKDNYIEGTENFPLDDLRDHLNELDKNQPILVFCKVGLRGYLALDILKGNGFKKVYNLTGGVTVYNSASKVWIKNKKHFEVVTQ